MSPGNAPANPFAVARELWQLLSAPQRRLAQVQGLLMIVAMGFETLGVGLVFPLLAMVSKPGLGSGIPLIKTLRESLSLTGQTEWLVVVLLAFLAFYVAKTVFLAFFVWRQASFSLAIEASLSGRLFKLYLDLPYTFHLQRNSAQLTRNVTLETATVKESLHFSMQLLTEVMVVLGLGLLLFVAEPVGAFAVLGVLGVAGWAILSFTRSRVTRWGVTQHHHQGLRLQHLQQGLGSVKEVKLLGTEPEFLRRYVAHTGLALTPGQRLLVLQQFPRLSFELLAISGLVTLTVAMLLTGKSAEALLPTLGLFAAAAFRLMPSVTRIVNAAQSLRFGAAAISNVRRELEMDPGATPSARGLRRQTLSSAPLIEAKDVSYSYPGAVEPSLRGVDLSIEPGEIVGLIGGSGAGKSTLVDCLLGLLPPTGGVVSIDGRDVRTCMREWQGMIGYVPQTICLTDDSLRRNIAFGVGDGEIDDHAVWRALESAQLADFVRTVPEGLDLPIGERGIRLSGGQKQRIGIARALYWDPAVLVLDEATGALDEATEADLMESVVTLKGRKTVLIVTHRPSTLKYCSSVLRIEDGRIISEVSLTEPGLER